VFAGLFAYVNVSPLLFMEGYGLSKPAFAALFAITASGVIVGSSVNAWLLNRHVRAKTLLDAGLILTSLAALALLAVGLAGVGSALIVAALVMVFISAFGLVFPNAVHEAIHPLPAIAGLVSAVVTTTQMLFGALGGVTSAALYRDASPTALGAIMSAAALSGAVLYVFWLRKRVEG
jgi:MFS transporter, DHA1 family, multidrug resistance protein